MRLGQENMLTNNVTKFDDDPLKNVQVTEQVYFDNFGYFKGHKSFKGSDWLLNLDKILCQQTMS